MIETAKYYLGGTSRSSTCFEVENDTCIGTTDEIYAWERGTYVNNGRPNEWIGEFALMYPSDNYYPYSKGIDNQCYNTPYRCYSSNGVNTEKNWINISNIRDEDTSKYNAIWTISPYINDDGKSIFMIFNNSGSILDSSINVGGTYPATRPVVYLSSSVKIIDGDGSESNPYKLSL